jgi:hypothetical protein
LYELYINKEKIGNQVLSPTISDYTKRVYYNVFDVAKNLSSNKNTVGVVLGNGRFFSIRPGEVDAWKEGIPSIRNFDYLIGSIPFLRSYLNYVVIGIIVLVTVPVIIKVIRKFK